MTKEKIIEIVNACVQYNANQGTWSIDNRFADELLAESEQEKTNTLKEFVEWYKKVLEKDYDDKGKIADKSIGRGDKKNFWYMEGQQIALQRIIDLLNQDLEKFLEERK